nr:MAG TPA_asm: hypothetical protein [Caudoviricetes sp.]DAY67286.1 MAG TPA: hypothetical protein [Caudoviricetes sp.]
MTITEKTNTQRPNMRISQSKSQTTYPFAA